ncbi:MAG: hypothetical protein M1290_06440 [Candidatus Thermoplasmatota archaeon]|jgi:hypothetical protein|nr:hypothetical protein [Candidatus Thermoplasmatota archaeon]MCL5790082.1 hypothetical protein [Candidatus Thermoplasmatota archaeon]
MRVINSTKELPSVPAVYALYGGRGVTEYVAYVGVAKNLRQRAEQHLVKHNSSVTTGQAAVRLETQYLTKLKWWEEPGFSTRARLEAAELVASSLLKPTLVSRGNSRNDSRKLFSDRTFYESIRKLMANPSGVLVLSTTEERIQKLEDRMTALEEMISGKKKSKELKI